MKSLEQIQERSLHANFTEVQQQHFDKLMSELEIISGGLGFAELKAKAEAGSKEALQVMRDYITKKEEIVEFIETKEMLKENEFGVREIRENDKVFLVNLNPINGGYFVNYAVSSKDTIGPLTVDKVEKVEGQLEPKLSVRRGTRTKDVNPIDPVFVEGYYVAIKNTEEITRTSSGEEYVIYSLDTNRFGSVEMGKKYKMKKKNNLKFQSGRVFEPKNFFVSWAKSLEEEQYHPTNNDDRCIWVTLDAAFGGSNSFLLEDFVKNFELVE
ncbi:hypothetical protein HN858_03820 [Candidatus Falkowbacteria bacterium]|jgi:hypothetical protein|nr:hypothetical protein [Candidatus Falkowbacteria bacterium]MBT5503437.1 hypothetical protein [Candidatus Falkowbacteria bacterium]MBT7348778.1 hypothetical protein [Candidatus Falkowbacteria bacterium]MBT7500764.1 hypothetical protein [Candidatus Falkowbacteria bacterium]